MKTTRMYLMYLGMAVLLFLFLQFHCAYDFFYLEQMRTFLFSEEYAQEVIFQPGGALEYMASFVVQFYAYPAIGPLVTSVFFLLIALLYQRLIDKLKLGAVLSFGGVLMGLLMVVLELDMNHYTDATLAMVLCLALLNLYVSIRPGYLRTGAMLLALFPLHYALGPAVLPLAACLFLIDSKTLRWKALVIPCVALVPFLLWSISDFSGETRTVFLPDAYYNRHVVPHPKIYYPWAMLLITLVLSVGVSRPWEFKKKTWKAGWLALSITLALGVAGAFYYVFHHPSSYQVKRLEYYRIHGEWDKLLAEPLMSDRNTLHACYQNLALAQKGVLADSLFHYKQCPPAGLVISLQGSQFQFDLMSDVYWAQGNASMAQKMAFDAMYFAPRFMHPRLMLRLIETNLVMGECRVAEKYIALCEQTLTYADRASAYRKYLDGNGLPEKLSEVRACLPRTAQAIAYNPFVDLLKIADAHPTYQPALDYLGCRALLENDLESFVQLMDRYYLKAGFPSIPLHFQEAMAVVYDADQCRAYGVSETVLKRYADFVQKQQKGSIQPNKASLARAGYQYTFWAHSMIHPKPKKP